MKRIIRLTESDLTRLVKRVIEEQGFMDTMKKVASQPKGQQVAESIKYLIKNASITNWWNKSNILNELRKLKTQADYDSCKANMGGKKVYDYIEQNLDTYEYDKSTAGAVKNPLKGLGTGLTDEEFNDEMSRILSKFRQ